MFSHDSSGLHILDLTPGKYYYDGVSQKITDTLKQINISKEELLIKILDKINQKILKEYVLDYLPSDPFVIGYVCGCAHAFEGREKKSIELSILQNKIIKKYLKTDLSSDDFKKLINDTKNDFGEGFK